MAVATLVEVLGEGFIKYMDAFKPYLLIGLRNTAEYQVLWNNFDILENLVLTFYHIRFAMLLLDLLETSVEP